MTGGRGKVKHYPPVISAQGQLQEPVGTAGEASGPSSLHEPGRGSRGSERRAILEKCPIQRDLGFGENTTPTQPQ